ncbi:hypothetical protein GDO78_003821 [Eleutherodactylus coqui]|uniref:Secreted protein n=1 Tax=Eleutherodactylus coqui TaxID=57060 RepID=A0A8J6K528_ELECQ|nr:hypothetical protein GDO78_003821 [Eleutherodactylus coqui]
MRFFPSFLMFPFLLKPLWFSWYTGTTLPHPASKTVDQRSKAFIGHHSLNPHCEFNDDCFLVRSLQSFSLCFPIFSVYTYIHNLCKKYSENLF